jgi:hypothetical protein
LNHLKILENNILERSVNMMTIKTIKNQLKLCKNEELHTQSLNRKLELRNLELLLKSELIQLLETQLNKKSNLKKVS